MTTQRNDILKDVESGEVQDFVKQLRFYEKTLSDCQFDQGDIVNDWRMLPHHLNGKGEIVRWTLDQMEEVMTEFTKSYLSRLATTAAAFRKGQERDEAVALGASFFDCYQSLRFRFSSKDQARPVMVALKEYLLAKSDFRQLNPSEKTRYKDALTFAILRYNGKLNEAKAEQEEEHQADEIDLSLRTKEEDVRSGGLSWKKDQDYLFRLLHDKVGGRLRHDYLAFVVTFDDFGLPRASSNYRFGEGKDSQDILFTALWVLMNQRNELSADQREAVWEQVKRRRSELLTAAQIEAGTSPDDPDALNAAINEGQRKARQKAEEEED